LYWFLQVPGICSFNLTIEVQQNQPGRVSVMLLPIIFSVALWLRKVKMQQFRCKPEPRYKLRNVNKKSMKCHTNHNFGGLVLAGRVAMCPTDRKEPAGERPLAKGVQRGSSVPSETETTLAAPL
jgi:hypothetical protein